MINAFFFFNDTATTEIYTLSLHDALPISGVWGLIWDPKINTESSKRFIQGVIDKYNHTPTSRCYLGYAAMMQILEAVSRAGTTDTAAVIRALEGHEFDGLKAGRSVLPAPGHHHARDAVLRQA